MSLEVDDVVSETEKSSSIINEKEKGRHEQNKRHEKGMICVSCVFVLFESLHHHANLALCQQTLPQTNLQSRDSSLSMVLENMVSLFSFIELSNQTFMHTVDATCSINFARPQFKSMTSLAWFINGEPAPMGYLRGRGARRRFLAIQGYPGSPFKSPDSEDTDDSSEEHSIYSPYDSESSSSVISNVKTLSIKFLVNPKHFVNGVMKMKCVASSIPEAFSRTHEEVILAEPSRGASFPGRYSSGEYDMDSLLDMQIQFFRQLPVSGIY